MMAQDPEITTPPITPASVDATKPDKVDIADTDAQAIEDVDKSYWIGCLEDAERAEQNWRKRGREIVQIYRNEAKVSSTGKQRSGPGPVTFNILYANTEVMLPAVLQQPPTPVVRSRFTKVAEPPPVMPQLGMGMMGPPPQGPGVAPTPPNSPIDPAVPPPTGAPPIDIGAAPAPGMDGAMPPPPPPNGVAPPPVAPPPPFGALPGAPPPPMPNLPQPAPGRPPQKDIETAASVMEKALEIVLDNEHSFDADRMAVKDLLLPGRGVCRVRWTPTVIDEPVMDPVMQGQQLMLNGEPQTRERKIWEEVNDEYVYWEDLLVDPVRFVSDMNWIAFRHLFDQQALETEFAGSQQYDMLKAANRLSDILKWTDESAAKEVVGGGSAMKAAGQLGDKIRKAMVWEIWDRTNRRIIWFIREATGLVLRVDPDPIQVAGFYPIPAPMLAVTTTDSRIPRPYYDLYAKLAADLDETSARISALTKQIKVRGAYNSASRDVADILTADDNTMLPVDGVDMINGGLANHMWLVPVLEFMNALDKLYIAREQSKQAIYEIMGISDIMRGATKASETATAQRIKGQMGMGRLEEAKTAAQNFIRDLLRLKAEVIAQNFDPETLEAMTGERVTPEVMNILRSDFMRTCSIDIETDSTVAVDLAAEQQALTQVMQSMQAVMQGAQAMLATGILPPPQIMMMSLEMLKMLMHPIRYSRGIVQMINDFQEQLQMQMAMQAMMPPPPPMGALPPGVSPAAGIPGQPGAPPGTEPSAPPEGAMPPPPPPNGAGAPPPM